MSLERIEAKVDKNNDQLAQVRERVARVEEQQKTTHAAVVETSKALSQHSASETRVLGKVRDDVSYMRGRMDKPNPFKAAGKWLVGLVLGLFGLGGKA